MIAVIMGAALLFLVGCSHAAKPSVYFCQYVVAPQGVSGILCQPVEVAEPEKSK